LAPNNPSVCFIAATLYAEQGAWADSVHMFNRTALLSNSMRGDAIDLYIGYFNRPDLALELAGNDVEQLRALSRKLRERGKNPPATSPATQPADEAIAVAADRRVDDVIRASADDPYASSTMLAEMGLLCLKRGQAAQAIPYLSRALNLDYGRVDWRMQYAHALEAVGRKSDAIHQAEIILRQRPKLPEAVDLIDRLSTPSTRALSELERGIKD
jgi:tetratricopeptide (TPR) repeat protein